MIPTLHLIAAIDKRLGIGRANQLPWHLPKDLHYFKTLTSGQTLLMGRKTAESLGRALPHRKNLVLTRQAHAPFANMHPVTSLSQALQHCESPTLWVIGGGEIYQHTLPLAQRLYLTRVNTTITDADTFFPAPAINDWQLIASTPHPADDKHPFDFCFEIYQRAASGNAP